MHELIQVGERTYYVNSGVKIGLYRATDREVYLIDSGNDKDAGRRVKKLLDAEGWTLRGIINTHSHADHIGANAYLQKQYGCRIFARGVETAFIQRPQLEPGFLYGGCPFHELRHKFLMAQPSEAVGMDDALFPKELKVIELPGHSFDMVGILTPDGTAFLADCVSSASTLEKYQISFLWDVGAYLQTLDKIQDLPAKLFVPSHTEPCTDMTELARLNREKVLEVCERLTALCAEPVSFEELLRRVFEQFCLTMSFEQYVLVGSTVRSYLAYLRDSGRLEVTAADNRILWSAAGHG